MTLGSRIKDFRKRVGMTQRELGVAVGFSPFTADVRIAQYENGSRKPKSGILSNLAAVFGVSTAVMNVPDIENKATLMQTLFAMEDRYRLKPIRFDGETFLCVDVLNGCDGKGLDALLGEWQQQLAKLDRGDITPEEYDHWRYNYS